MLLPYHPHQSTGTPYGIQHEPHRHHSYDPGVSLRLQARFTTSSHDREARRGVDPYYLHPHQNRELDFHYSRNHLGRFLTPHRDSHSFSPGQDVRRESVPHGDEGYHARYPDVRDPPPPPYSLLDNGTPLRRPRETDMVYDDNGDPIGYLDRTPRT